MDQLGRGASFGGTLACATDGVLDTRPALQDAPSCRLLVALPQLPRQVSQHLRAGATATDSAPGAVRAQEADAKSCEGSRCVAARLQTASKRQRNTSVVWHRTTVTDWNLCKRKRKGLGADPPLHDVIHEASSYD